MIRDGELYIDNTVLEISHLMEVNFDEAIELFNKTLTETASNFGLLIEDIKTSTNITIIIDESKGFLNFTTVVYKSIIDSIVSIQGKGGVIKNDIDNIIDTCSGLTVPPQGCSDLQNSLTQVKGLIDEMMGLFRTVGDGAQIPTETVATMNEFAKNLDAISTTIDGLSSNFIEDYFDGINTQIAEIGATLREEKDNIVNITDSLNIFSDASSSIDDIDQMLTDYYSYFHLSLIVIGSVLVVILVVLFIGLGLGCCGSPGSGLASKASTIFKISIGGHQHLENKLAIFDTFDFLHRTFERTTLYGTSVKYRMRLEI
jgi:hypothetical protein